VDVPRDRSECRFFTPFVSKRSADVLHASWKLSLVIFAGFGFLSRATTVTHQSPSVVEEWGCGKDVPTLTLPPRPHRPSTPQFCTPPLRPRNPSTTKQQPDCKRQIICRPRSRGSFAMVLQDLGRRINSAVSDLTRAPNLDEKASSKLRVAGGWLSRNVATMSRDPHE
jgi:hypothetical protein